MRYQPGYVSPDKHLTSSLRVVAVLRQFRGMQKHRNIVALTAAFLVAALSATTPLFAAPPAANSASDGEQETLVYVSHTYSVHNSGKFLTLRTVLNAPGDNVFNDASLALDKDFLAAAGRSGVKKGDVFKIRYQLKDVNGYGSWWAGGGNKLTFTVPPVIEKLDGKCTVTRTSLRYGVLRRGSFYPSFCRYTVGGVNNYVLSFDYRPIDVLPLTIDRTEGARKLLDGIAAAKASITVDGRTVETNLLTGESLGVSFTDPAKTGRFSATLFVDLPDDGKGQVPVRLWNKAKLP